MSKSGDSTTTHLAAGIRELLSLADEARIRAMQRDRWIDYARQRGTGMRISVIVAGDFSLNVAGIAA